MAVNRNKILDAARKSLARGQYDKAIAQYQKLVDDDPTDVRSLLKIGDMQTRKGDRTTAAQTYQRVADHYAARGFFLKAVAVYKQILKLDPSRLDIQVRLGEMYEQLQLISDAMTTYEDVANSCMRTGETDRGLSMLAKMVDLDGEHIPVRIKYAEALSRAGRADAAASEFERGANLLKSQGRIDDYVKVSERLLYHRSEDIELARELASTYLERNDAKRALAKLQVCFKANPRDVQTLELLGEAFKMLGQKDKTISVYREIARIHREAQRPDERVAILERILELDPSDADARRALEATIGRSPKPKSTQVSVPASAVVRSEAPPLPNKSTWKSTPPAELVAQASDSDVVLLDDDDSAIESVSPDTYDSIPSGYEDTVIGAEVAQTYVEPTPERMEPTDIGRPPSFEDTAIPTVAPSVVPVVRTPALAAMTFAEFEALQTVKNGASTYVRPPVSALEKALESAEFFMRKGMLVAARGIVSEIQQTRPDHPLVVERALEIDDLLLTSAGVASVSPARLDAPPLYPTPASSDDDLGIPHAALDDEDQSFAIAEKLADELVGSESFDDGDEVLDVETVFGQFKKGVAEQVAIDDSDTHFDLGIAYKEMGLLEDARREFQVAMSAQKRLCLCWMMIGLCYMEEGRAVDAIESFRSGLDVPDKTDAEEIGLFFEMGFANDSAGRTDDAIKYYERVYARNPQFRQVSKRLAALQSTDRPRRARSIDNIDDLDQAFDDLLKFD